MRNTYNTFLSALMTSLSGQNHRRSHSPVFSYYNQHIYVPADRIIINSKVSHLLMCEKYTCIKSLISQLTS